MGGRTGTHKGCPYGFLLGAGRLVYFLAQGYNFSANGFVAFDVLGDFLDAVAYGAVIAPAQEFADVYQRQAVLFTQEVHCQLTGVGDLLGAGPAEQGLLRSG